MELPHNAFKHAIREGRQQIGLWSSLSSNYTVEVIAGAGFDWILLDTEHSPNDLESVLTQAQAAAAYPTSTIARVPWNDMVTIKRFLDIGIQTLLIPYVCTVQEAKDAVGGKMPLDSLFSKEQRAFYRKHAPKGIALRSLETYGPTFVLKARKWLKQLDRRLVVEMWLFPDGSRNLEISMKCAPSEAFHVAQDAKEYFKSIGIELSANQQTKTRAAMQFFQPEVRQQAAQRKRQRRT